MDSRLFIDINFVGDTFHAIDTSPYERWQHDGYFDEEHSHLVLQRLVKVNDEYELIDYDQHIADTIEEFAAD